MTVWTTGRTEEKRKLAKRLGAHAVFEPGARLPGKVDAVFESVGEATWAHSCGPCARAGPSSAAVRPAAPTPARTCSVCSSSGSASRDRRGAPARNSSACSLSSRARASSRRSGWICRWSRPGRASPRWRTGHSRKDHPPGSSGRHPT
ncbi:hypothetical protein ACFQZP_50440 [Streptomyces lutosisoli]|uniref:Alcohol dehydrogenase-like C-terminal domain-containing protein n=1 Tax=Streptomyces lutosisoli TaxID=2665721 RepID=A0ABW2VYV7_9ACTN